MLQTSGMLQTLVVTSRKFVE
ncbi:MAG: hypothetical protein HW375_2077, partial [Anaerolineales bacterium]|nr:hypothetical protein [Anaerolineales bacterium]